MKTLTLIVSLLIGILMFTFCPLAFSENRKVPVINNIEQINKKMIVKPNEAIMQVQGIVCSFCAYGVQKNLSKLDFIDTSKYNDGVLIDINAHLVTLAIKPTKKINIRKIIQNILEGGYEPIKLYLHLNGKIEKENNKYVFTMISNGQKFNLKGNNLDALLNQRQINLQSQVNIEELSDNAQRITLVVD